MNPMESQSVYQALITAAHKWPNRPLFNVLPETASVYRIAAGEQTYAYCLLRADQLRSAYEKAGYRPGMRIMLLLENRPEFFLHFYALNALGLSIVPVNPDLRAAELEYMIGHCEPALAISIAPRRAELAQAAKAAGIDMPVLQLGEVVPPCRARKPAFEAGDSLHDREAAILYTSGTTGQPKGCILSNGYFLMAGNWYASSGGLIALSDRGEKMITPLPIFHMNALACSMMVMMAVGGSLTCLDRFHPRSWWESVKKARATCLHYLGVMPSMLMGMPENAGDADHSVRFGFGAGVDKKLHADFERRFGFPLVEAWAMTETGCGAVICANQLPRRVGEACLGRVEAGVEVRIVDDNGSDVKVGHEGELLVRHGGDNPRDGFFSAYWKNPLETEKAWAGGWFHTGDIVRQETDGNMFFVDRKKNVIRRSGENIAAVEVESVLMRHPAITAAAVAAVPDAVRGDEVFACLCTNGDTGEAMAHEIAIWCLDQMAYYKVPGFIAFVEALPLTSTQKIQRGVMKSLALELLDDEKTINTTHLKRRQAS